MGKTACSIKLIQVLSSRYDFVPTDELAEILGTNKRNIREYIEEIELLGYTVESKRGKEGGYRLNTSSILPIIKLEKNEVDDIKKGVDYINNSDYEFKDNYLNSISKLLSSVDFNNDITPALMIDRFPLSIDRHILQERYLEISKAIEDQLKCEIKYLGRSNKLKNHKIQPYQIFGFGGNFYVLAKNESVDNFGYFKLNRIESIFTTREHFVRANIDSKDYLTEFGLTESDEFYRISLELKNLNVVIQERIYGRNQEIEVIDDKTCILNCDMQNQKMILSFVLSFGMNCKVLSPDWLKDMVSNELEKALENYM